MAESIVPVILSGGSGKRLWPLSRPELPKQFLPLVGSRSLFDATVLRLEGLPAGDPVVVCNEQHEALVERSLRGLAVDPRAIVLEPVGRNTAPALAAAAIAVRDSSVVGSEDPLLLVLPSDQAITDAGRFRQAVLDARPAARDGRIVTFGVVPDRPETGYGYIRMGSGCGGWHEIAEFVEKPDATRAQRYVESGEYLWNSGMFLFSAAVYLDALGQFCPDVIEACRRAFDTSRAAGAAIRLGDAFAESPSISIDHAVMERTRAGAVVPLDAGWSDLGSWAAITDIVEHDAAANALAGSVVAADCRNAYIRSTSRPIIAIGLEGLIVVETSEGVLVMRKSDAQRVGDLVGDIPSSDPAGND